MTNKHSFTSKEFVAGARDYFPMDACIRELDAEGKPGKDALLGDLRDNRFYSFDSDAALACIHAVEDFAIDAAEGRLSAGFQDWRQFEPGRERYEQLGSALDHVEVAAAGKPPRAIPRVTFVRDARGAAKEFWMTAYEGRRGTAMFIARQAGGTARVEERQYTGFFSFSPRLSARLRDQLRGAADGSAESLPEFARLLTIDQFARQIDAEMSRQRDEMAAAVRRLQTEAGGYRAGQFASDLEKGLTRLQQWKNRLPAMLERVQGD